LSGEGRFGEGEGLFGEGEAFFGEGESGESILQGKFLLL
jgi:hypothetical protein